MNPSMNIDFTRMITAPDVAAAGLSSLRDTARAGLSAAIEEVTLAITGPVPLAEKLSWASKEEAARDVLAALETGIRTAPPIIAGEAAITGETVPDLARRILRNADAYRAAAAAMTGLRRKAERALDDAGTAAGIAAAMAEAKSGLTAIAAKARGG